jgi:hypothetical protein
MGYENKIPNKTVSTVYLKQDAIDKNIPTKSLRFIFTAHGFNLGQ